METKKRVAQARLYRLEDASREVLECRDFGHAWSWQCDEPIWGSPDGDKLIGWVQWNYCMRCQSRRWREIEARHFTVNRTGMRYIDGYLAAPGRRFPRTSVRAEITHIRGRDNVLEGWKR